MRTQIAAANWKMNLTLQQGQDLLSNILSKSTSVRDGHAVIFAVAAPYLQAAKEIVGDRQNVYISAQNIYSKISGAYTGETSVEMLKSVGVYHTLIGHSERREYFNESNQFLADKVDTALANNITPIFCLGESLEIRESGKQNEFVATQLEESLFHLSADQLTKVIIAYEPIWAIGTGKTASSEQAEEIQKFLRDHLAGKYGQEVAEQISILYGGSVKPGNAKELFGQPNIDGGLVGGASLVADDFVAIIDALS